jgi:hypothetical protein
MREMQTTGTGQRGSVTGTPGARLRHSVTAAIERLDSIPDDAASRPATPGKWSPKEVVGHLIDSACNNHARFVRATLDERLEFPGYDQEAWVSAQDYASADWRDLVSLWRDYNLHLARIVDLIPREILEAPRSQHNLDVIAWKTIPRNQPATLEYFIEDYIDHLEHHLEQICNK